MFCESDHSLLGEGAREAKGGSAWVVDKAVSIGEIRRGAKWSWLMDEDIECLYLFDRNIDL